MGSANNRLEEINFFLTDDFTVSHIGETPQTSIGVNSTNGSLSQFFVTSGSNVDATDYLIGAGNIFLNASQGALNGTNAYIRLNEASSTTSFGIEDSSSNYSSVDFNAGGIIIVDSRLGLGLNYSNASIDEVNISWATDDDHIPSIGMIKENISSGGGGVYDGASPTNTQLGAIPSDTDLTGMTWQEIIEMATVAYLSPVFSSFSISGQNTLIEVGETLSGIKTFTWGTTNVSNIVPNSINIDDVSGSTNLATGITNDGSEDLDIGTVNNTSPITQQYRITGTNTQTNDFNRNFSISSIYPYFYGTVASGGAGAGANRPVANQALIDSGVKVLNSSSGTITINFNSTADDYLWFAIPTSSTSKNTWYTSELNNGSIGGAVSPSGNLFPDFDSVSVDSPEVLWNGVTYKIYISNFQSAVTDPMQLRNS